MHGGSRSDDPVLNLDMDNKAYILYYVLQYGKSEKQRYQDPHLGALWVFLHGTLSSLEWLFPSTTRSTRETEIVSSFKVKVGRTQPSPKKPLFTLNLDSQTLHCLKHNGTKERFHQPLKLFIIRNPLERVADVIKILIPDALWNYFPEKEWTSLGAST